jgi:uncharacterized membrane protein YjgN (DUF898 family)
MSTNFNEPQQSYRLEFHGKGSEYFAIMIVNWLLTVFTFGLYYPWARAKQLRYIYGQTSLNQERFHFSGTGKEMFRGFIMVVLFYIAVLCVYFAVMFAFESPLWAILFIYLAIFSVIPFAIHGSLKYRLSRTTYRGIRFGYRGDRMELTKRFFKDLLLTVVTLGIYGAWFQVNIRRYTHAHMRYGEVEFSNDAKGLDYFVMNLKGYLLSIITLGIYIFWWQRDMFEFYINHMKLSKGDQKMDWKSTATGGGFFKLQIVNLLIVAFTFGFGIAWVEMRNQKFICDNILMDGDIDLAALTQTEQDYKDATGEDAADFLDIDVM